MTGASHAWPSAYLAVLPPSGPPVRAVRPVLRPLQPSQPPPWPRNRRLRRPPQPWPRPSGRPSTDARCSPATPPVAVLLSARSMVRTVGALSLLLGRLDTLLAVGTRLSRWDKMGQNGTKWRARRSEAGGHGGAYMHAHGARALEPGGGRNGDAILSGRRLNIPTGNRSACCRRLPGGTRAARDQVQRVDRALPRRSSQESASSLSNHAPQASS